MRDPSSRERLIEFAVAALMILPLLAVFVSSFGGGTGEIMERWSPLFAAFSRSMMVGAGAVGIALLIGLPAGWVLARSERPLWLLVLIALPLALPASVTVSGWVGLLAAPGVASRFRGLPGLGAQSPGALFSIPGAALVLGSALWPVVAFETWPAFRRARNESFLAALLASSRWRVFAQIVLPQVRGELIAAALLTFILASSDFSVCSLLLVRTLPIEIHDALVLGHRTQAAWLALPLLVTSGVLGVTLFRLARTHSVAASGDAIFTPPLRLGKHLLKGRGAEAMIALGIALGFAIPMTVCLVQAVRGEKPLWTSSGSGVLSAGSDALGVSLRLAGAAALLALLCSILRLLIWPDSRTRFLNLTALFLLAVPGSFLAAALLEVQLGARPWAENFGLSRLWPAAVLICGMLLRFLYLPLRLIEEGLAGLDPDLLDAARLSGHGRFARGLAITVPLLGAHLAAGCALVFILVLGEVPISATVPPPGIVPATVWLFQQQHLGYDEAVFGLSLLLGAVSTLVLLIAGGLAALITRWTDRRAELPV